MFKILLSLVLFQNIIFAEQDLKINFPSFDFPISEEKTISNNDLKGKYYLVNFFFANCLAICPTINGKAHTLQEEFKSEDLNFLSLSVDSENDTFEVLNAYAKKFKANSKRWHFAKPQEKDLNQLIEDLKLAVGDKMEDHSTRFILVNPKGQIHGFYQALNNEDFKLLKMDLKKLF